MQSNAQAKAKRRMQEELRSRNITIKSGMAPRTIALGTVRTSGPLMFAEFVGPNQDYLDSIVAINAGELSELLGIYIGDEYIPVGAFSGDIPSTGKYGFTATVERQTYEDSFSVTGATSVTLTFPPEGGVVLYAVLSTGSGESLSQVPLTGVSVAGSVVSWTGAATGTVIVGYRSVAAAMAPLRAQWVLGTAAQATTTWSGISSPKWTSNHRLRGVAYVRTLKLVDHPLFLAGDSGDVGAVVRGPKGVWDPRSSTTLTYTSNPALLAAWYRTLPVADGGMGVPSGWIDWASVSTAANVCDELISVRKLDNSGYENVKRYECHTRLSLDQPPADNLAIILSSMAGEFPFTGGYYKCFAGAFRSAVMTLTDDDVAVDDPISYTPEVADSTAPPNQVTATFVDANRNWVRQPAKPVVNSTYVTADGAEESFEVDLEATTDQRQANYLMGVRLERARPSGRLQLTATGKAANLALMDTVQVSLEGYSSIASKTFEVRRRTNQFNGRYPLELREVRASTYTLDADRFTPPAAVTVADNSMLFDVDALTGLTAAEEVLLRGGRRVSVIRLNWTAHAQAFVRERGQIQLRWRIPGQGWIYGAPLRGAEVTATTDPVPVNVAVACEVRPVNGAGAAGPWTAASAVVTTGATQPLVTTQEIAANAATEVFTSNVDLAGGAYGTVTVDSFTVTPAVASTVEFTAKVTADNVLGDSGSRLEWWVTPSGGSAIQLGGSQTNDTAKQEFTATNSFSAAAGVLLTFELKSVKAGGNPSLHFYVSYMRATVIKR